jgi:hypothetical protein
VSGRLPAAAVERLLVGVAEADREHRHAWPGPPATRQPVQVLYVPADRLRASTAADAGAEALRLLDAHAPDPAALVAAVGIDDEALAGAVRERVAAKLAAQPVEDLRVDFEDGYLGRDAQQEAADAAAAAAALAAAVADGGAPPFVGLRVKPFCEGWAARSIATLDGFLDVLLDRAGGLPDGFVVTFPKVVAVGHVRAFAEVLAALEEAHGLPEGRLRFEVQVETTPSVLGADGRVALRAIREAAGGRLVGAHMGIFDYTAALALPPAEQRLDHPACDLARHLLQVSFAGTEVRLSDGSTNAVPAADTTAELHRVWARHAADVRHSLRHGFVQGWDLHPSHLVSRYAAVYAHLLDGMPQVLDRLAAWHAGATGGGVLDEPATVRTLEAQVQRAVDCGAVAPAEVRARTGLGLEPRPARVGPEEEPR